MKPDDKLRAAVTILLIIGAILITSLLFLPWTQDFAKNPVTTGIFGTVLGFWFKELSQSTSWLFGSTKASQDMQAQVTAFAVTPGTVTNDAAPAPTIINNSTQGTTQ